MKGVLCGLVMSSEFVYACLRGFGRLLSLLSKGLETLEG